MSNPDCLPWFQAAWAQLEKDFQSCKFTPQDEPDVCGHLYHCIFQIKDKFAPTDDVLVTVEWHEGPRVPKVDLAIIQNGFLHRSPDYGKPLLLAEVKETDGIALQIRVENLENGSTRRFVRIF